jgi:hypothetical protein
MKQYSSFEELNRELEIHKIQAEISKEKLKLNVNMIKNSLSPTNIGIEIALGVVQKLLYGRILQKIFRSR